MRSVAYLTSKDMMPGRSGTRPDLWELEAHLEVLEPACAAKGIALQLLVWDEPIPVQDVDAILVGTTWDYQYKAEAFLERLDALAGQRPVWNDPALIRWNARKTYLQELATGGVDVVPTLFLEAPDGAALDRARHHFGVERLVVKNTVGAGAIGQHLLGPGDPLPSRLPAQAMVQPFLQSVATEGELSFVFVDGAFSHAVVKRPQGGDYRVQATYGGTDEPLAPSQADVQAARSVVLAAPGDPMIARVDLVRGPRGQLLLMELEVIEPYLYPKGAPGLGLAFAAALDRRLQAR